MKKNLPAFSRFLVSATLVAAAAAAMAETNLADAPIIVSTEVPPNVMMALSVEWPTGTVAAYNDNASSVADYTCSGRDNGLGVCYFPDRSYLGYFDPAKCYSYNTAGYFEPKNVLAKNSSGVINVDCTLQAGRWSGNFLNWAAMHALDSFRYAMTGGDRVVDTTTLTVVEKSQHTGQGGYGQFPSKRIGTEFTANSVTVPRTAPGTQTPETWDNLFVRVTDAARPLWEGSSRAGKVLQVANNSKFWSALPSARYVKIQLVGNNVLSLAEVQVQKSDGTNVAQGKTTSQSSSAYGGVSSRAVDGNTDGTYNNNSVTHTTSGLQPWWQVDLGASEQIRRIRIFNRTDCCEDRLQNFYIFVSSSDMSGKTMSELLDDASVWKYRRIDPITDTSDGVTDLDRELLINPDTSDVARDAMNARVKLCDVAIGLESNCKAYGSVYKPVGVVQEKSDKMRFGVMSYLNVDGQSTMGGVLRSPLKYVGPKTIVPNGIAGTNPRYEIDSSGIVRNDPEGAVTSGSEYQSSGVINYLNRFGKTGTKTTLKSIDTVSEMYYETLRYLRGSVASGSSDYLAATPEFINFAGADQPAAHDGFPFYTDWTLPSWSDVPAFDKEPVQYWCQRSNIVGIGDTNAWCDSWGPGSSLTSGCTGGHNGSAPPDRDINASTLANTIGENEAGLTGLGSTWISTSRYNSYYIASYAYWANSVDMILDDAARGYKKSDAHQTAQTYWVDVRETGSFNGITGDKNQYWLAGRWGGFDNGSRDNVNDGKITKTMPDDSFADPTDTNYFTGERPDKLISAMRSVFDNISEVPASAAPTELTSNDISTGTESYQVSFNASDWTGEVVANAVSFNSDGEFVATEAWRAADNLDAQNWESGRQIVTYDPETGKGVKFLNTTLNTTQRAYFGSTTNEQRDLVNYLRGDRRFETGKTAKYREREHVLGDIVNADPVVVGKPSEAFDNVLNPGFDSFAAEQAARKKVLYVAANDGMLHAFDGTADGTGGQELFAYVPSAVLSGPSTPATPSVDGIAHRANVNLDHHFLVDQAPTVRSVDFNSTGGNASTWADDDDGADWRTLLVGGLGKGGRSYYALDVTDPTAWTSEDEVAKQVLWEFTDADMGYSFAQPVITKMNGYGWVVILTSGYNNIRTGVTADRGKGFMYVLNAKTGVLLKKVSTGVGSEASPSGLAKINAFEPDSTEAIADAAYAGDLFGNLWRFDLTASDGNVPLPTKIAEFKDSGGTAQPITAEPRIVINPGTFDRWVFAGTGRLLDLSDRQNSQDQAFYGFRDGTRLQFFTSSTLPDGISFPIDSGDLADVDDSTLESDGGLTTAQLEGKIGWVRRLTLEENGANERMVDAIVANSGVVAFATKIPSNEDVCVPGVKSRVYAVSYATANSQLVNTAGEIENWIDSSLAVLRPDLVIDASGNLKLGQNTGGGGKGGFDSFNDLKKPSDVPVRLNWREVIE
jgi:type IV pilus assembly protein PilY1